jgi:hypothetical protein
MSINRRNQIPACQRCKLRANCFCVTHTGLNRFEMLWGSMQCEFGHRQCLACSCRQSVVRERPGFAAAGGGRVSSKSGTTMTARISMILKSSM